MRVLIGCERFGVVRDAFLELGHDAWSCDLVEADGPHIVGDVLEVLQDRWDLAIVHPDCTYLCASGLHWNLRVPGRAEKTEAALEFVRRLLDVDVPRLALENPVGAIGSRIRPADQYIQPYQFGDDASKRTGLWLRNLPPLQPTKYIEPRLVHRPDRRNPLPRWANQTDSGQNRLGPSDDRAMLRARTYPGIAKAMAEQWGSLL